MRLCLSLFLVVGVLGATSLAAGEATLAPSPGPMHALVTSDGPAATIVISNEPDWLEQHAASELQGYVRKITGKELPIVNEPTNPDGFGIWAGTAINDTSSVVAAAYSYSQEAGDVATITKLARTVMIIPIAFGFAVMVGRARGGASFNVARVAPWFVLGFLGMAVLNTTGVLGSAAPWFATAGKFAIAVALAGVGLGANLGKIIKTGPRPILLGLVVWIVVACASLVIQSGVNQM